MRRGTLVSVVVPVYNIREYVSGCLSSLISQSYSELEILVIDDGSTDESGEICDEFSVLDSRVKVFHTQNGGLSSARNFGISKAKGEYVALVDGDDFVEPGFIREMLNEASKVEADVAICGYNNIVPRLRVIRGRRAASRLLVGQENLEIVAWNKLYRRSLFKDILYPEGKKFEDCFTTYKLLAAAEKVVYVPAALYHYREREGSIMNRSVVLERLFAREAAAEEAVLYFGHDKDLKAAAEVAVLLSKYAFVDAWVRGEIESGVGAENLRWIKTHMKEYEKNPRMTWKLKLYGVLVKTGFYKTFRKIKHE